MNFPLLWKLSLSSGLTQHITGVRTERACEVRKPALPVSVVEGTVLSHSSNKVPQ